MFHFKGEIITSKSWLNRALVMQHFNPTTQLTATADSDDVRSLQGALRDLSLSLHEFDLGLGGTSFRFFSFLVSRYQGEFLVKAHARLLARPQGELLLILKQLGVQAELRDDGLHLKSNGWLLDPRTSVQVAAEDSSQFISGLLLSAWNLDQELKVEVKKPLTSFAYLQMTISLLQKSGMKLQVTDTADSLQILIPAKQKASVLEIEPEPDVSSAFSLVASAVVNGDVEITNWNANSTQPDQIFLKLFTQMGISYQESLGQLKVQKQQTWRGVSANLNTSPDLFPVLAVLCALAEGESILSGAAHLRHKESDRIAKTAELLQLYGFRYEVLPDGMKIWGRSSTQSPQQPTVFNPEHDHRMAMAAAVLKLAGYSIQISTPEVVNKSYPTFWRDVELVV
ncbi:3-phosphoshikimate 1-carboxyvinyltransferase [Pseudobdellovibrio exovorus]|uniref:3-phosphoshikimate 1-carboxyvinyltransferase n=1 Tax=Pseudobdellovibrio exovorus JSS TaxID=1184267 RepID=M4V9J1_9BACT|nr:3-phosphoshikimate 1-carboxyvinyltransferase [Pseudobdellovibrio exovorus]AGH94696.1 EPSP synthase (3-phosphoshikimate 1-carboxyvinyltransferase), EPSP synthase (3-phosphoshikimate 1-carboxyvinyltransferase) [Pseudobdellovibrio exovorus JSS]